IRYENNAICASGEPVSVLDFPCFAKISCFLVESKYMFINIMFKKLGLQRYCLIFYMQAVFTFYSVSYSFLLLSLSLNLCMASVISWSGSITLYSPQKVGSRKYSTFSAITSVDL